MAKSIGTAAPLAFITSVQLDIRGELELFLSVIHQTHQAYIERKSKPVPNLDRRVQMAKYEQAFSECSFA